MRGEERRGEGRRGEGRRGEGGEEAIALFQPQDHTSDVLFVCLFVWFHH